MIRKVRPQTNHDVGRHKQKIFDDSNSVNFK